MNDQPIQPPRRTRFIDVADRVIRGGRRLGVVGPAQLDRHFLMDQAAAATGLDDFGDRWFERPFDALLDSVKHEARLNAAGDFSAMKQFHHVLRDRLYAAAVAVVVDGDAAARTASAAAGTLQAAWSRFVAVAPFVAVISYFVLHCPRAALVYGRLVGAKLAEIGNEF